MGKHEAAWRLEGRDELKYQTVCLEKFCAVVRKTFPSELISRSNLEIASFLEPEFDRIVLELRAYLASEKLSCIDIKHPKDWWQAFKERWFPKWLLRRYPVQYHEEHYDVRAFYPKVSLPEERHFVRILKKE